MRTTPFFLAVPLYLLASCDSTSEASGDAGAEEEAPSGASADAPTGDTGDEGADATEGGASEPAMDDAADGPASESVYALNTTTLEGDPVDLADYDGKVTVFVNVASRCGYTPQYSGLQELHAAMGGDDFAIVGVPSNDFGGQEPGTADEIRTFCEENYGVTFTMLEKVGTKEGESPLMDRLAEMTGERPSWNFCKYVVSRDGTSARFFASRTSPDDQEFLEAIEEMLSL